MRPDETHDDDVTLTAAEAASLARRSTATIWRWAAKGCLPAYRAAGRTYFVRRDVIALVALAPR